MMGRLEEMKSMILKRVWPILTKYLPASAERIECADDDRAVGTCALQYVDCFGRPTAKFTELTQIAAGRVHTDGVNKRYKSNDQLSGDAAHVTDDDADGAQRAAKRPRVGVDGE
jgi:hypothetical protein